MLISSDWTDLKAFSIAKSAPLYWAQANNSYYISATTGPLEMNTQIFITDPPSPDQEDFEENYKS